jgi:3-methyladenine DNA glycosylase/8-oxoguanine DNA glycosylase
MKRQDDLAVAHLKKDRRMRALIERVGPPRFHEYSTESAFECLLEAIVSQQLSGKVAKVIYGRLTALCGGGPSNPKKLAKLPDEAFRQAGLSRAKVAAVRDLCDAILSGRLDIAGLEKASADEVIAKLCQVRGVGPWTAQMVLIFALGSPDVWPSGDLGVRKSLGALLRLPKTPDPIETERLSKRWRPYRSYAAWYLWQSNDGGTEKK